MKEEDNYEGACKVLMKANVSHSTEGLGTGVEIWTSRTQLRNIKVKTTRKILLMNVNQPISMTPMKETEQVSETLLGNSTLTRLMV
jgi:hypothetical protein